MRRFVTLVTVTSLGGATLLACGGPPATSPIPAEAQSSGLTITPQEAQAILALVNDDSVDFETLDEAVGLDRRAAYGLVEGRPFTSVADVDEVPYVGKKAFAQLLAYAKAHGYFGEATPEIRIPSIPGVRFSENVFRDVATRYEITDTDNLLVRALSFDDGNRYLKRAEIEGAAESIIDDQYALARYRFGKTTVRQVMRAYQVRDRLELLVEAIRHDADGNRYLKKSELESAAEALGNERVEIGIISDIDKTLLPPHARGTEVLPLPYPGITQLLIELETRDRGRRGDTYYVTARSADRIEGLPAWMQDSGLPRGPISTGISPEPWVAEPEKVADIEGILEATAPQPFVLFGDSSHRDPEVYRTIVDRYPDRIVEAFIHRVNNVNPTRVEGLVAIDDYAQAAARLLRIGALDEGAARRVMVSAQAEGLDISDAQIEQLIADNAAMD